MFFAVLLSLVAATVGSITGLVRNDQGKPAAGVSVSVQGGDIYTTTDEEGRFVLSGILLGSQKVRFHAEGFKDVEVLVPIDEGMNTVETVTLAAAPVAPDGRSVTRVPSTVVFFSLEGDCLASQGDSLHWWNHSRVDSTLASWGRFRVGVLPPPITFQYDPVRPLKSLSIVIVDDGGRVVKQLHDGRGDRPVAQTWDGRDALDHEVPFGEYAVRFIAQRDSVQFRFCRRPFSAGNPRRYDAPPDSIISVPHGF